MATGRELQRERERRGVAVEAVCAGTKVSVRHLEALEAELYDELPGGVFTKGILRSYCAFLGLDADAWVARFAEENPEPVQEPDWGEFAENVSRSRTGAGASMGVRWWGVLLMLLALAGTGWAAWHFVVKRTVHWEKPEVVNTGSPPQPTRT